MEDLKAKNITDLKKSDTVDLKGLEFLAVKSKEMVEKQVSTNRAKQGNAGTIIGVITLFIPFFLIGLNNSYDIIKYISVIPVVMLIISLISMLKLYKVEPFKHYQFFKGDKYIELSNKNSKGILSYEIGSNIECYERNIPLSDKLTKRLDKGLTLTIIAIIFSSLILLANQFYKPIEKPNINQTTQPK